MNGRGRSGWGSWRQIAAATWLVLGIAAPGFAGGPRGSQLANAALAACDRAKTLDGDEQSALLAEGAALADAAVRADPNDPVAHFADFCNHGRRLERQGLGLGTAFELTHARRALDAALKLAPDYPDALAAKGALLLRLPRLFGGDRSEGIALLRRAVALAPDNSDARRLLDENVPATGGDAIAVAAGCE